MSVNRVILLGRLGQDPELKYTPSGAAVCNFSLATNESWTDKSGQRQEKTEWHRIVVWGKTAELCGQYLGRGRQAYLEGKIQTRSWDGQDGQKRYTTEVVAATVRFLDGRSAGDSTGQGQGAPYGGGAPQQSGGGQDNMGGDPMSQDYQVASNSNFTADDIPF